MREGERGREKQREGERRAEERDLERERSGERDKERGREIPCHPSTLFWTFSFKTHCCLHALPLCYQKTPPIYTPLSSS